MSEETESRRDNPYRQELYKTLLAESQGYLSKMAGLWLQKLVLVGGVMVFLYGHRDNPQAWETWVQASGRLSDILALATLALPLLALLLDLKHLECAIQARNISLFIRRRFADEPDVACWEASNWGDVDEPEERLLPWVRTLVSSSVAALPTLFLTYFSLAVIYWRFDRPQLVAGIASAATLATLVGSWLTWRLLWPGGFRPLWKGGLLMMTGLAKRK